MKILALDIGDVWTGIAISDALGITSRPYQTVHTPDLKKDLRNIFAEEPIKTVVVGHPTTLKGTKSAQTIKTEQVAEELKETFPEKEWVLWDERYSSQQAAEIVRPKNKQKKLETHAVAAALFLMSYLDSLRFNSSS